MTAERHARQLSFVNLAEPLLSEGEDDEGAATSITPKAIHEFDFAHVVNLPPFAAIDHGELFTLSLSNNTASFTHGLHRFPAKFIPQIPRWALEQFGGENTCVLDPFMGSGTTLVEGLLRGGTAIGVDIDPLARLISRAKTELPSSVRIVELGTELRDRRQSGAADLRPPMPDISNFDHWFSRDTWAQLQSLLHHICSLDCDDAERRFLLVIFSSILRWVSNADDQSQKTYVSGTLRMTPPGVEDTFWRTFKRAVRGLRDLELARNPEARVIVREAAHASSLGLDAGSVDLIVTSPPYLDSVDYMYNFMLEYFWLGPLLGVSDRKTFNRLRRHGVGAKHPERTPAPLPAALADFMDLDHMSAARQTAAAAYFTGMFEHFLETVRCMRVRARYVLVIGNSQTREGIVPVHDCLIRLAAAAGMELEKAFAYRVRRHYMKFPRNGRGGIILLDWVIVLRKADRPITRPSRLPLPWVTLGHKDVAN